MPSKRPRQGPTPHSRAFDSSEFSHQRLSHERASKTSCGRFARPAICFREGRRGNGIGISLRNGWWTGLPKQGQPPRNYRAAFALTLRVGAHGGRALMRIGPIFPVMTAIALIAAAAGLHAVGSGLAEGV